VISGFRIVHEVAVRLSLDPIQSCAPWRWHFCGSLFSFPLDHPFGSLLDQHVCDVWAIKATRITPTSRESATSILRYAIESSEPTFCCHRIQE
jgi:hypothetical protein